MASTIQIRKIPGNWNEDIRVLDVKLNFDDTKGKVLSVLHTVESDRLLTHGGGAKTGEYLHYKSVEVDADKDGDIDYSMTSIHLQLQSYGFFNITVKAKITYEEKVENPEAFEEGHDPSAPDSVFEEEIVESSTMELHRSRESEDWI